MRKPKKKLIIPVFLAITLAAGSFFIFLKPSPAEAEWFDDNWYYRKPITITNSGSAISNYPAKVTLSGLGSTKLQADCDDIRVTDNHGKLIAYQIETCSPSGDTIIWLQSDFSASIKKTFYFYYGNPSASAPTYAAEDSSLSAEVNPSGDHTFWLKNSYIELGGDNDKTSGAIRNLIDVGTSKNSAQEEGGSDYRVDYHYESTQGDAPGTPGSAQILHDGPIFKMIYWTESHSYFTVYRKAFLFANYPILYQQWSLKNTSGSSHSYTSAHHTMTESGRCYDYSGGTRCSAGEGDTVGGVGNEYGWFMDNTNGIGMCKIRSSSSTVGTGWRSSGSPNPGLTLDDQETSGWYEYYLRPITADSQCTTYYNVQYNQKPTLDAGTEENGPGPVAYWRFDEGYGDTTYDDSVNNKDGNLGGTNSCPGHSTCPSWESETMCKSGKCLYFDGTADYVWIPTALPSGLFSTVHGPTTLELWFKPQSSDGYLFNDTCFEFGAYLSGGNLYACAYSCVSTSVELNKWHHLALVHDHSLGLENTKVKLYLNGVFIGETTEDVTDNNGYIGEQVLLGGSGCESPWDHPTGGYYKGFIDEIKAYPYARSAAEIRADFQGGGAAGSSAVIGPESAWISDGLVAHWKMDESSSPAADSSGNGNSGTWNGTADDAAGKFGNSISLDGDSDYISVIDSSSLSSTSAITISSWVYTSQANFGSWTIVGKGSAYQNQLVANNNIQNSIYCDGGWTERTTSTAPLTPGAWNHVVITFDGQKQKIYANGSFIQEWSLSCSINDSANTLYIGSWGGGGEFFNGLIDDVRIYNRALFPQEVRMLYEWAPGPVLHLKMDEKVSGDSQTLYDTSSNENNGTTYWGGNASGMDCTQSGKYGGACQFDGVDDYIDAGSASSLDITGAITLEAWVKIYGLGSTGWTYIICRGGTWRMEGHKTGTLYTYLSTEGGADYVNSSVGWTSEWQHIAFTYNSSTGLMKYYVDGTKTGEKDHTYGGKIAIPTESLRIGGRYSDRMVDGYIDDVRIYNYARTQKQIIEDMNAGHPAVGSPVGSYVGYWKFDEGYGDTAYDMSIHNNDGDLAGTCPGDATCPSRTNNGRFGKALSFDGDDDYVDCGNVLAIGPGVSFTYEAWLNPPSQSGHEQLVVAKTGWHTGLLFRGDNNSIEFARWNTDGGHWVASYTIPSNNQWYHAVGTYDASTKKLALYVNGEWRSEATLTGTEYAGSSTNYIGGYNTDSTYFLFEGKIDDVKIYPFALTKDEVWLEYNRGAAAQMGAVSTDSSGNPSWSSERGYCPPGDTTASCAPIAEWKMDEKIGDYAYDTSGNGNTGTFQNSPTWTMGKKGAALEFDNSDWISTSLDLYDLYNAGGFTVEAWSYDTAISSWDTIASSFKSSPYDGFFLRRNTSGATIECCIYNSGSSNCASTSTEQNVWIHWACTYSDSVLKLYKNGIYKTQDASASMTDPANTFKIGANYSGSENWEGKIDHVVVYDYARDQAQIAWDYNRGKPVGWWRFDECQGTTAYDMSDNDNDGDITIGGTGDQDGVGTCTVVDATKAWYNGVDGKRNYSLSFDGTDDYVEVPDDDSLNITDAITIGMWIKPDTQAETVSGLWWKSDVIQLRFEINKIKWLFYNGTTWDPRPTSATMSLNEWHYIAVTYDKDGGANNMKVYLDGTLSGQDTKTGEIDTSANLGYIGRMWGGVDARYFNGIIDEVKIYNYALTEEQVKMEYNQGASVRFGPSEGTP